MANNVYDHVRVKLLSAQFSWATHNFVLSLWSGTPNFVATDETIAQIKGRGGHEVDYSMPMTGNSISINGTAQSHSVMVQTVPIGPSVTWLTLSEINPTTHDQSKLVLFIDQVVPPLPYVPNGLDLMIQPDWNLNRGWWRP